MNKKDAQQAKKVIAQAAASLKETFTFSYVPDMIDLDNLSIDEDEVSACFEGDGCSSSDDNDIDVYKNNMNACDRAFEENGYSMKGCSSPMEALSQAVGAYKYQQASNEFYSELASFNEELTEVNASGIAILEEAAQKLADITGNEVERDTVADLVANLLSGEDSEDQNKRLLSWLPVGFNESEAEAVNELIDLSELVEERKATPRKSLAL